MQSVVTSHIAPCRQGQDAKRRSLAACSAAQNILHLAMASPACGTHDLSPTISGLQTGCASAFFWQFSVVACFFAMRRMPPICGLALGASDVRSLVRCCPNLCMIEGLPLQHGSHVTELHKLTALTNLRAMSYGCGDVAAVEESLMGLATVTQLRELLVFVVCPDVSKGSLLPLTSLTALEVFQVDCRKGDDEESESHGDDYIRRLNWRVFLTEVSHPACGHSSYEPLVTGSM